MVMKALNNLLHKTRFSITERVDMADIMMGHGSSLTYRDWIELISKNNACIYMQSKHRKLYIKIEDDIYELYFIEKMQRHDYFKLLEQCARPLRVNLIDIEEHSYTQMDSYFGISSYITAVKYIDIQHDIFYTEPLEYLHDPIDIDMGNIDPITIIEERKDYLYFRIDNIMFEAKELVGSFHLYHKRKKILKAVNKNDVFKKAVSYADIIKGSS
jgi:hypothetical protein